MIMQMIDNDSDYILIFEIGKIVKIYDGRKLIVEESKNFTCSKCFLNRFEYCGNFACSPEDRPDKKHVILKELLNDN